jgi:cysteine desulfurase
VALLTVAAHKFGGPLGIGALVARSDVHLTPIVFGGFQQEGLRPGTECLALAVGLRAALETSPRTATNLSKLRDAFERRIVEELPDAIVNASAADRLPNTSNVAFLGLDRQELLLALDAAGVCCSTGSACASGSSDPSPVLLAMGLPHEVIASSLRFSFGTTNTLAEAEEAACRILKTVNELRGLKMGRKTGAASRHGR